LALSHQEVMQIYGTEMQVPIMNTYVYM
jgi:hypothetical protein